MWEAVAAIASHHQATGDLHLCTERGFWLTSASTPSKRSYAQMKDALYLIHVSVAVIACCRTRFVDAELCKSLTSELPSVRDPAREPASLIAAHL